VVCMSPWSKEVCTGVLASSKLDHVCLLWCAKVFVSSAVNPARTSMCEGYSSCNSSSLRVEA
jgi:hypothetical protein